jgi:hypothetical protein
MWQNSIGGAWRDASTLLRENRSETGETAERSVDASRGSPVTDPLADSSDQSANVLHGRDLACPEPDAKRFLDGDDDLHVRERIPSLDVWRGRRFRQDEPVESENVGNDPGDPLKYLRVHHRETPSS